MNDVWKLVRPAWGLGLLLGFGLLIGCGPGRVGTGDGGMDAGAPACTGCVDPATGGCVRGASDVRCGAGGATCTACGDGEECVDQACVPRGGCGAGTCPGCCRGDICVAIERDDACGSDGEACVACPTGEACVDGVCTPASSCGPASCAGCCDDAEACQDGSAVTACGRSGGACEICPAGYTCEAGTCTPPCADWCGGCCDADGTCHAGTDGALCGAAGAACADCGATGACSDGTCITLSCSETCDGCCEGDACLSGTLGGACGASGAACVDCGPAFTCSTGRCAVDPLSRWDVRAVRATFSPFNPGGSLWDTGSAGRPDPYASAEASSASGTTYSGQTARIDDTTSPFWYELVLTDVPAQDLKRGVTVRIRDYDLLGRDDDIGWCFWRPTDAQFAAGRIELTCPARSADPATVEIAPLVLYLERH